MLYDQGELVVPLLKTVVDLKKVVPFDQRSFGFKGLGSQYQIEKKWKKEIEAPTTALFQEKRENHLMESELPTNAEVLFVMPFFLILICLFCAVGFFNICRDDMMDELHASGIDVIRSEEGGVKQAPREHEY
ncbi:unnamed protein product [Strongylus vulgaris]|uniref:Uncharacterized protein n=1 Tax=Strongylus vulgaris TaxID=40348 RepID=A0A3P7KSX8_STRVU|nr:unnamed protein product [Strongylus vulgaris]